MKYLAHPFLFAFEWNIEFASLSSDFVIPHVFPSFAYDSEPAAAAIEIDDDPSSSSFSSSSSSVVKSKSRKNLIW